jgi:N-formylmaleamate deformylase
MYKPSFSSPLLLSLLTILVMLTARPTTLRAQSSSYSFAVARTGHGPALILLPGLYCSGEVWKETVAHYEDRYTCYSLTLPGFAGQPAIHSDSILATVADDIARYIKENHLGKPLVVGHSLGGWLALDIAVKNPGLLGGIVCVSSSAFLPGLSMGNDISVDSTSKIGAMIKGYMSRQTPEQAMQSERSILPTMIRDSGKVNEVLKMAVRCDPATQGECMYELFSTDLRAQLNNIQCPVLVLGDWVAYKEYGATRENVMEKYRQQFSKAPHVQIVLSDTAKHFIMFDEPIWFFGEVDDFFRTFLP